MGTSLVYQEQLYNLLNSNKKHHVYFGVFTLTSEFTGSYSEDYCNIANYSKYSPEFFIIQDHEIDKSLYNFIDKKEEFIPINLIDECLGDAFFEMLRNDRKNLIAMLKIFYNELYKPIDK